MVRNVEQILLGDQNKMEHVAGKGENRNVHRVLVGKPELKRPLGTSKGKWKHENHHHHHHHHHPANMQLAHLLTHSGLTSLASLLVSDSFFCDIKIDL
jgi:hypothetical protein